MTRRIDNEVFFAEMERQIGEGRSVTLRVRGNSMRPLLRDGRDSVVARRHRQGEIAKGAVMFFRYNGVHVMHRVRSVDEHGVVFAGDGNYRTVERVQCDDVVALVTHVIRPDGRRIDCAGRRWRIASAAWLMLPPIVRRCILGAARRLTARAERKL